MTKVKMTNVCRGFTTLRINPDYNPTNGRQVTVLHILVFIVRVNDDPTCSIRVRLVWGVFQLQDMMNQERTDTSNIIAYFIYTLILM